MRERWHPQVRDRIRAQAESRSILPYTRARFTFASAAGSSDDPRLRLITQHLSAAAAREPSAAHDAGAGKQQVLIARAPGHAYFRAGGRRAQNLQAMFTDVEFADFSIG